MSEDNAPEPIISTYSSKYPLIPKRSYTTILDSKKEYMFTHIETLIALAALECEVGRPLTEAHGRGVRLTRASHRLLTRVEPLVASLCQALQQEELQTRRPPRNRRLRIHPRLFGAARAGRGPSSPDRRPWGLLQRRLRRQSKQWGFTIEVSRTLQTFTSIVQMARHGFGHGLVPEGVARALGIRPRQLVHLPEPTLTPAPSASSTAHPAYPCRWSNISTKP